MKTNRINEKGIDLSDVPGSYITPSRELAIAARPYYQKVKEIKEMFRSMRWQDIQFYVSGTYHWPVLPADIKREITEANRLYNEIKTALSSRFDNSISGAFKETNFGNWATSTRSRGSGSVKFELTSNHRSHMPGGIPNGLKGLGIGYKLYRALIEKAKFVWSGTSASASARRAWQSVLANKPDPDDVHAIVAREHVCAIIKNQPDSRKISQVNSFLNVMGTYNLNNITATNFKISPELKEILPEDVLVRVDPERREEARRIEREREAERQRERAERQARRVAARLQEFGVEDINDHDWDIGDFVVLKEYVLQQDYEPMPIRMVVARQGRTYYALKIEDAFRYFDDRNYGLDHDNRRTTSKNAWTKVNIQNAADNRIGSSASIRNRARSGNPMNATATAAQRRNNQAAPDTAANNTYPAAPEYKPMYVKSNGRPWIRPIHKRTVKDNNETIYLNPMQYDRYSRGKPTECCIRFRGSEFLTTVGAQLFNVTEMGFTGSPDQDLDQWLGQNGWKKFRLNSIQSKLELREGQHVYVSGGHRSSFGMVGVVDSYLLNNRDEEHAYLNMFDSDDNNRPPRKQYVKIPFIRVLEFEQIHESKKIPTFSNFIQL